MGRHWIVATVVGVLVAGARGQQIIVTNWLPKPPGCEESKRLNELRYDNALGRTAPGPTFEVKLLTPIDSAKDKPGKKITAVVTAEEGTLVENTKIRHRAKIVGHIEEVQKRDETHPEAHLRLVFDRVKLRHGRTLAFTGVVHDMSSEHVASTEYWEPSATDPLGHWVHISDWPSELGQYCYTADSGQGVVITAPSSNIHLGYYTLLTIRAVPSHP